MRHKHTHAESQRHAITFLSMSVFDIDIGTQMYAKTLLSAFAFQWQAQFVFYNMQQQRGLFIHPINRLIRREAYKELIF